MRTTFPPFDSMALGAGADGHLRVLGGRQPKSTTRDEDTLYLAAWEAWGDRWMIPSYNPLSFSRCAPGGYLKVALGNGHGALQAVGLAADHQIYLAARMDANGSWHAGDGQPLGSLRGVRVTDLVVVAGNDNTLQVIALTETRELYLVTWLDNETGAWSKDSRPIGNSSGRWTSIAAAKGSDGALQIVALGADQRVYLAAYQDPSGGWHVGAPASLRPGPWAFLQMALGRGNDGHLQVVGLGTDQEIYLAAYQEGSTWHEGRREPLSPGHCAYQTVAMGIGRANSLEIIGLGQGDRKVYRAAWQKNSDWHYGDATPLDARSYRQFAIGNGTRGDLQVVGLTDEGRLYVVTWQDSSGNWREGQPLSQTDDTGRWNTTQLVDVPRAFASVPDRFTQEIEYNLRTWDTWEPWPLTSHYQGMALYKNYYILPHSAPEAGGGDSALSVLDRNTQKEVRRIRLPNQSHPHPGGCQVVGDYLALELEAYADKAGHKAPPILRFYWLGSMDDDHDPTLLPAAPQLPAELDGASAIAITDVQSPDRQYLVALRTGRGVTFFRLPHYLLDDPDLELGEPIEIRTNFYVDPDKKVKHGPDNLNLLRDTHGAIYLLTMGGDGNFGELNFKDWADLWKVDLGQHPRIDLVQSKHIITSASVRAFGGVHFRYGAGSSVGSPNRMTLFGSEPQGHLPGVGTRLTFHVDEFRV